MNRSELERVFSEEGIRPNSYCLNGGLPTERHTLEARANGWAVYYSERGTRTSERSFKTESEACRELLQRVLGDPSTRARRAEDWDCVDKGSSKI